MKEQHLIEPVYNENSRILILGSFPSVRSREVGFFYGHPQNRFWRVLSTLYGETLPDTVAQKKDLLLRHGIALWDVIASCDIVGSSDASIKNVVPNDVNRILSVADIKHIYTNGKTAHTLYDRYLFPQTGREAICLPSTSPANAAWSLPRLCEAWRTIMG